MPFVGRLEWLNMSRSMRPSDIVVDYSVAGFMVRTQPIPAIQAQRRRGWSTCHASVLDSIV
jgi:hypothetical protein